MTRTFPKRETGQDETAWGEMKRGYAKASLSRERRQNSKGRKQNGEHDRGYHDIKDGQWSAENRETVRETGKGRKGSGLAHDEGGIWDTDTDRQKNSNAILKGRGLE